MKKKITERQGWKGSWKSVMSWHLFILVNIAVTLHNLSVSLLFYNQVSKLCLLKKKKTPTFSVVFEPSF